MYYMQNRIELFSVMTLSPRTIFVMVALMGNKKAVRIHRNQYIPSNYSR